MSGLRERYGDGPLHLIVTIASLAFAGYAFVEIARNPGPVSFAIFFAGAIVCHDLVAFPLYSLLDRIAGVRTGGGGRSAVNYVRVPALLSGFALIVWFPLILGLATDGYVLATGTQPPDYLARWLAFTGVLFACSGVAYAIGRRSSARGRDRPTDPAGPRTRR